MNVIKFLPLICFQQSAEYVLLRVKVSYLIEKYMLNVITKAIIAEAKSRNAVVSEQDMFCSFVDFSSYSGGATIFAAHHCCTDIINQAINFHHYSFGNLGIKESLCNTLAIVKDKLPHLQQHSLRFVYQSLFKTSLTDARRAKGDVTGSYNILNHPTIRGNATIQELLLQYAENIDKNSFYYY